MWRITLTSARHCRAMIWRTPHRWAEATTPKCDNSSGSSAYAINDKLGAMDCHKGVVSSYTTDYVCNGGEKDTVRQSSAMAGT